MAGPAEWERMGLPLWEEKKVPQGPSTAKAFFEMLSVLPGFDFERSYSSSTCSILG